MRRSGVPGLMVTFAIVILFLIWTTPALAKKPEWSGDDRGGKNHSRGKHDAGYRDDRRQDDHPAYSSGHSDRKHHRHFSEQHFTVINNYYVQQWHSGPCPPGLAKKGKNCVPPGHHRKWQYGRPLPAQVIYYDLPPAVLVQLGPPPSGHKFVRVAQDILMIAVGTGMVVDAVEDIGQEMR